MAGDGQAETFEQLSPWNLDELRRWTAVEDALTVRVCDRLASESTGQARAYFEGEADDARRSLRGEAPPHEPCAAELRFRRDAAPRLKLAMARLTMAAVSRTRPQCDAEGREADFLMQSATCEEILALVDLGLHDAALDANVWREHIRISRTRLAWAIRVAKAPDVYGAPRLHEVQRAARDYATIQSLARGATRGR